MTEPSAEAREHARKIIDVWMADYAIWASHADNGHSYLREHVARALDEKDAEVADLCLDVTAAHSATDRVQAEVYTLQENLEKARRDRASIIAATKAAGIEWRENEDGAETCHNVRAEQAERRRDEARANADFLRESIGECHLMISRDSPDFQMKQEWNSTDLPPRLGLIMRKVIALEADRAAKAAALERAARAYHVADQHGTAPGWDRSWEACISPICGGFRAALASSPGAAWLAWARGVLPLLSAVTKMVEEIKAAAPEGEMVKRWVEDAGECARALLARAPEGVRS